MTPSYPSKTSTKNRLINSIATITILCLPNLVDCFGTTSPSTFVPLSTKWRTSLSIKNNDGGRSRYYYNNSVGKRLKQRFYHMAKVGDNDDDDNNNNNQPPSSGNGGGGGSLDDFLDPRKSNSESDNLKRARAQLSDTSLPINYDESNENDETLQEEEQVESSVVSSEKGLETNQDNDGTDSSNDDDEEDVIDDVDSSATEEEEEEEQYEEITSTINTEETSLTTTGPSSTTTTQLINPYLQVVSNLSPSDLISKFTSTAHPQVQDAVRSTILSLIGTLPQMAFETTTITTGERLANLMFQLQMSGYMFKNAEYRMSLSESLKEMEKSYNSKRDNEEDDEEEEDNSIEDEPSLGDSKVRGRIKVTFGKRTSSSSSNTTSTSDTDNSSDGDSTTTTTTTEGDSTFSPPSEVEVDAQAYTSELRNQVSKLRAALSQARKQNKQNRKSKKKKKDEEGTETDDDDNDEDEDEEFNQTNEEIQKDLLTYIRTLPKQELSSLTSSMSEDVLIAMKGLVNVVMNGIVGEVDEMDTDEDNDDVSATGGTRIGPDTVTEQSGEAMAQLCMWQLVVGYNLREMEVREEMKNQLSAGSDNEKTKEGQEGNDAESDHNDDDDFEETGSSIDFNAGGFE